MHGLRETGIPELKPAMRAGTRQEILDALRALPTACEQSDIAGSLPSVEPAPPQEWLGLIESLY